MSAASPESLSTSRYIGWHSLKNSKWSSRASASSWIADPVMGTANKATTTAVTRMCIPALLPAGACDCTRPTTTELWRRLLDVKQLPVYVMSVAGVCVIAMAQADLCSAPLWKAFARRCASSQGPWYSDLRILSWSTTLPVGGRSAKFRLASTPVFTREGRIRSCGSQARPCVRGSVRPEAGDESIMAVVSRPGTQPRHSLTHPRMRVELSDCA